MWFFRKKKIIQYCPICKAKVKISEGEIHPKQTKKGIIFIFPSKMKCKKCKNEINLPSIIIKNDGSIKHT